MTSPTIDILVPVWNNPFETRACLAAILAHSPGARLIVVDNASSRETELMLEEFSETLGDKGLFIKSERNIGQVAAINVGLSRSDSDYTVMVCPHVTVKPGWLDALVQVADAAGAGMVSPLFNGKEAPYMPPLVPGCSVMESCSISFATLLLRTEMRMVAGVFDDTLDGDEWCLNEYVRRVASHGYRTCLTGNLRLSCSAAPRFGSALRRSEMLQNSRLFYISRWGELNHYVVYFGPDTAAGTLGNTVAAILEGARHGHRFTLLLHRRQCADFRKMGWNGLHTGVELQRISLLFPLRDLHRKISALRNTVPELVAVRGCSGISFPGDEAAVSFEDLAGIILSTSIRNAEFPPEATP
jgi:glycosyltransferase involved in cell wall biosynthesis